MSTTQILVLSFGGIALLAAVAIFTIAFRRTEGERKVALDRRAEARDRSRVREREPEPEPEPALVGAAASPPVDPLTRKPEVTEEEFGVTRRQFFNRGLGAVFGIFMAQFGLAALAFMWPKLASGGFGSRVNAGSVADIESEIVLPDGRVQPLFVSAAQSYLLPFRGNPASSQFDDVPVIAGGIMALWQRCVHLGCRVPWCVSSQGFECPCHGSKYNSHGEYEDGPAPRNLDRFVVEVNDADELIIDTGTVIQTSRASVKSVNYPQGPSCL
ncbi:MAG: ubiquinol-cytochrome c reductase iron-sulfur subunit [Acidimicrobiia bacterium]|nr:ubiquinol-cytochrome c reductase iron-sulfur subunit [Acidimicrobiia bacterium]